MAYYDKFIAAWNAGVVPAGCTGIAITGGMTTVEKLAALNGWVQTGSVPAVFQFAGVDLLSCLDWTEFAGKTAAQQTQILTICAMQGALIGGANSFIGKMFVSMYSAQLSGPTITALTALAKAVIQPWWQANGYLRAFDLGDTTAAGLV